MNNEIHDHLRFKKKGMNSMIHNHITFEPRLIYFLETF